MNKINRFKDFVPSNHPIFGARIDEGFLFTSPGIIPSLVWTKFVAKFE